MSGVYEYGEVIVLGGVFTRTDTDAPADPDAITVTVVKPDGTPEEVTAALGAGVPVGDWEATFTADQSGIWTYHVMGTGGLEAVGVATIYVRPGVLEEGEGS